MKTSTAKTTTLVFELILGIFWWVMLGIGIITHNEWLFGPAAFFILLDAVTER